MPYPSSVFKIAESGDFESTFPQGKVLGSLIRPVGPPPLQGKVLGTDSSTPPALLGVAQNDIVIWRPRFLRLHL